MALGNRCEMATNLKPDIGGRTGRAPGYVARGLWRKVAIYLGLACVYLVSTVPVGLGIYSLKTHMGYDAFSVGGFHAFQRCLATSFPIGKH